MSVPVRGAALLLACCFACTTAAAEEPLQTLLGKPRTHPAVQAFLKQHGVVISADQATRIDSGKWEPVGGNFRLEFDQGVVTEVAIGRGDIPASGAPRAYLKHPLPLAYGLRQGMPKQAVFELADPSIVSREEKPAGANRLVLHHAPDVPYDTIFTWEGGADARLVTVAVLMKLELVMAARQRGKVANRIDRIRNPIFDALWKRCDRPEVASLLALYNLTLKPELCDAMTSPRRLDRVEDIGQKPLAASFRGGVLESLSVSDRSVGANPLPLGLELGVTTPKQLEALQRDRAVESLNHTSSYSYTLGLRFDNPFEIVATFDAANKLQSVRITYKPTAEDQKARDLRNKQERDAFDQLLARVDKELHTPTPQPAAPASSGPSPQTANPGASANDAANAPILRRIAELRAQLGNLKVQYQLAADDQSLYGSDRSYKAFEGSYGRRDSLGRPLGTFSSYSSRQSASAMVLEGAAKQRMAQIQAQFSGVLIEIERLQRQLK